MKHVVLQSVQCGSTPGNRSVGLLAAGSEAGAGAEAVAVVLAVRRGKRESPSLS